MTPIVGAKIQLLLTDPRYRFREELGEFTAPPAFESENGKTSGALSPNEFWYFWRRFLPVAGGDVWSDQELGRCMDMRTLRAELSGMMHVFDKPFAAKGMLFNYHIPFLYSMLDDVIFVQIKRDPVENVASVLDARRRQLGTETAWYSFRIPEFDALQGLDPVTQAAGQVWAINRAVGEGMSRVADSRRLCISYEGFCSDPALVFQELADRLELPSAGLSYQGPSHFCPRRKTPAADTRAIQRALAEAGRHCGARIAGSGTEARGATDV